MGSSSWSSDSYANLKTSYTTKSTAAIFTSKTLDNDMSPKGIKFRESRDSDAHPETLAIAVFLDETGSMGEIPETLVRHKLGSLMETLISHGIAHPAVLFGGIGDHISDKSPLQVGQFESGTDELNKWLTKIYLEGNGGGQEMESYLLAWIMAARHTSIDCFEKRQQKGFLFTIGDERSWEEVDAEYLKSIFGYTQAEDISIKSILEEVKRTYHVFHIHANETGYKDSPSVIGAWKDLLGERLLIVDDHDAIAEVIASTVAVVNGIDLKDITKTFDKKTANIVTNALVHVSKTELAKAKSGVVNL